MSILGSIGAIAAKALPGVGQALGGMYAANKSAKASKKNTAAQINWELKKAQNTVQWTAEDMKKAGINPAVAAGQQNQVGSINPQMPDTSGYQKAGDSLTAMAKLMQRQQEIDSQTDLNDSMALKNRVTAGLMPRETAVKEMNAQTERRKQEIEAQEAMARIQQITALLPYETEEKKQLAMQEVLRTSVQLAQNPGEIERAKMNSKVREMTGGLLDADEAKKIGMALLGAAGYDYEKRKDRTSAEKISQDRFRNHREIEYNSRGKQKSVKYYEYQN